VLHTWSRRPTNHAAASGNPYSLSVRVRFTPCNIRPAYWGGFIVPYAYCKQALWGNEAECDKSIYASTRHDRSAIFFWVDLRVLVSPNFQQLYSQISLVDSSYFQKLYSWFADFLMFSYDVLRRHSTEPMNILTKMGPFQRLKIDF